MNSIVEHLSDNIYLLRVTGVLVKSELDEAQKEFVENVLPAGSVKLLILLENFTGWDAVGNWEDTEFFFNHRDDFEKIAVVGDPQWEAQVLAFSGAGMRNGPVKYFPTSEQSAAEVWLTE